MKNNKLIKKQNVQQKNVKSFDLQNTAIHNIQELLIMQINEILTIHKLYQEIKAFVSVPQMINPPYLAINRVLLNKPNIIGDITDITFEISIIQNNRNNLLVLTVLELLNRVLCKHTIGKKHNGLEIINAYNYEQRISEAIDMIDVQTWTGSYSIRLVGKLLPDNTNVIP